MTKIISIPSVPILVDDLGMIYPTDKSNRKAHYGVFKCSCGELFKTNINHVKNGNTNSCGCFRKQKVDAALRTHSLSKHRLYKTWYMMKQRCENTNHSSYKQYGGKGIFVCARWQNVSNFIEDMYQSFNDGLTIDRIDSNGNYEPSNCRWATKSVQARNTTSKQSNNTSGYRGVCFDKSVSKWVSRIIVNNKHKFIGLFNDPKVAAIAYDTFVIVYGLEHTTNFPKGIFEQIKRKNKMVNIQEEVNEMYQKCLQRIESDFKEGKNFSFHHYAVKYGLNPHRLQSEWVSYNHAKKGKK